MCVILYVYIYIYNVHIHARVDTMYPPAPWAIEACAASLLPSVPSSLSSFRPSLPCTLSTLSTLYFRSSILEFHSLIFLFPWPQEVVELTRGGGVQTGYFRRGGVDTFGPGHTGSLARALLDPQDHPGASQEPPRATQDRIKIPQERSKIPQERPKIP